MTVETPLGTAKRGGRGVLSNRAYGGGLAVMAALFVALVGWFLVSIIVQARPAFSTLGFSWIIQKTWDPTHGKFGLLPFILGTIETTAIALVMAVPIGLGTAIALAYLVPHRLRAGLSTAVELLAAVPSVVYGLWGWLFLQGRLLGTSRWIATWFGWIPIFKVNGAQASNPLQSGTLYSASTFIVGVVVSLMVIPILCSIMRESFSQAPLGEREGAYALGATRWGMIRTVVIPFGKGGIIGGTMLGLGRALGETIVVILIISPVFTVNTHILQSGGNSVSGLIANLVSESSKFGISALMAAGLALFALTLAINFSAAAVVARSRSGAESDL